MEYLKKNDHLPGGYPFGFWQLKYSSSSMSTSNNIAVASILKI